MKSKLTFKIPLLTLTALGTAVFLAQSVPSQAFADSTAEFKLIEGIIRVSGTYDLNKENDKYSEAVTQVLDSYAENHSEDPQTAMENLRQASVDLNLYTPQQAEQFAERMQEGASRMSQMSNGTSSSETIQQEFPTAIADLLRTAPEGARFSGCNDGSVMTLANIPAAGGMVMLGMALVARIWNPNCQDVNVPVLVATGDGDTVTVYKEHKVCGPNPHVPWAEEMAEWGGIAFGVSAVLDIILVHAGCSD